MKYTVEQLMPKRYPENRPSAKGDYWIVGNKLYGTTKAIWNMFNPDWIERVSWFIDIPGAPEEVRPRKYPDEKPEKSGKYIAYCQRFDKWEAHHWYTVGGFRAFDKHIDYFIPYPLEEEMETLDDRVNKLLDELLEETQNVKDLAVEAMSDILDKWGYDITKREPEIALCPFCGSWGFVNREKNEWENLAYQVRCINRCGYRAPYADTPEQAIEKHNLIAGKGN